MKKATNKIKLVSYEMKMTIPTGQYANIQPCIVVKGGTIEEAHDFIAPHMNKLWKEYFMCSERVTNKLDVVSKPIAKAPTSIVKTEEKNEGKTEDVPEKKEELIIQNATVAPVSAVAMNKATQAIYSCVTKEALGLIANQIEKSVKLSEDDKVELRKMVEEKEKQFNA